MERTLRPTERLAAVMAATVVALAIVVAAPPPAAAHAELVSSNPVAGAELEKPPTDVVIVFDGELDPDSSGFVVTDAVGGEVGMGEVDLDVAGRNELRGTTAIDEPGTYTVAWTATSADGHAEEGSFEFTVLEAQDVTGGAPDTALPAADAVIGPQAALGFLVLVVAGALSLRQLLARQAGRS